MSCCGGQRVGTIEARTTEALDKRWAFIRFEYIGASSLTFVGNTSGRAYHFAYPGNQLPVDARDAPGASAIPVLRRID